LVGLHEEGVGTFHHESNPDYLSRNSPIALVAVGREYPANDVLRSLMRAGYHVLERQADACLRLPVDLSPQLIVAVLSPTSAQNLELLGELAAGSEAFVVMLAPDHAGRASSLKAGAQAFLCDGDGPEVFEAQFGGVVKFQRGSAPRQPAEGPISAGGLLIDPATHVASYFGTQLKLPPREFSILLYLAERQGTVCRTADIFEALGPKPAHTSGSGWLTTHILRIRKELRKINPDEHMIVSAFSIGYRLVAE
jgi:DNA-binding response OmpR family regulator